MDLNKLERANTLAKGLLPKVNKLLDIHNYTDGIIGETLKCLLGIDEDFSNEIHTTSFRSKTEVSERV